jgi:hypothetical protein
MVSNLGSTGIRFNDCFFSEPVDLSAWTPPKYPGLFAILVTDPNWAPKAFQPLYFGEFSNNSPATALLQECMHVKAAAGGRNLLVAVLPMPFSTSQQRWALRDELIRAYNPVLQTGPATTPRPDLAYKLDELEKKHQEQIHAINAGLDTQPARRRQFGFVFAG